MKTTAMLLAALLPVAASAHDPRHRVVYQASELVSWCRDEATARYVARNITPYNWTASYHDRSNILYVDGRLRVHDSDVDVHCRLASGARLEYAVIEIDDPAL